MPSISDIVKHETVEPPAGESAWIGAARPSVGIEIVQPDPDWQRAYAELALAIRTALGWRVIELHHVGSTSIPNMPAKPIIDISLTVARPAEESDYIHDLEELGYVLRIREPWWQEHRLLRLDVPRVNLHVYGPDASEPIRNRLFRDWVAGNDGDFHLYREAKLTASAEANERGEHTMEYNLRKEQVIREILNRAFVAANLLPNP